MRAACYVAAALYLAACAPAAAPAGGTGEPAAAPVESHGGIIRVVGSAPVDVQVVLRDGDAPDLRVEGPLAAELRRLSGAEVVVTGHRSGGRIHATGYDVRRVDGAPVVFGTVEAAPDGGLLLRTARGDVVRLEGASGLRVGQKAWVQGPSTLQVQSYGVVRQ